MISFMKALSVLTLPFFSAPTLGPIHVMKANFALLLISSPVSKRTYPYTLASSAYMGKGTRRQCGTHQCELTRFKGTQQKVQAAIAPPRMAKNSEYSVPEASWRINLPSYVNAALRSSNTKNECHASTGKTHYKVVRSMLTYQVFSVLSFRISS